MRWLLHWVARPAATLKAASRADLTLKGSSLPSAAAALPARKPPVLTSLMMRWAPSKPCALCRLCSVEDPTSPPRYNGQSSNSGHNGSVPETCNSSLAQVFACLHRLQSSNTARALPRVNCVAWFRMSPVEPCSLCSVMKITACKPAPAQSLQHANEAATAFI